MAVPVASQLQGRVDAIEGRRLYGWVWNRTHPTERLLIRITLNGGSIASATADMPRVDLRRNGIGDGGHAFEVELPDSVGQDTAGLAVVAIAPSTGEELVLQAPSQHERAAEAAINAPLSRVFDRLDLLIEAQRRSQVLQREAVESLRGTSAQISEIVGEENGIAAALDAVRANQSDLAKKISDIEVFHMRFDRVLADFGKQIDDLGSSVDRPMKRAVTLLMAFGGISAVSAIAALVVLLRHPPW
ncbi:hypothetical protein HPT29_004445 [Microvirga terrae]|uniref:DUF4349 domain-containing protein n=1 Tax=Microvirga terrae TaxID=2740529 RepID=A0ABY5RX98_9HYPH|nr:hypothetical protein [Microvirga terrae]UVF20407.1 hypothetical protein HPT29_004445 [Microvirga terrae]